MIEQLVSDRAAEGSPAPAADAGVTTAESARAGEAAPQKRDAPARRRWLWRILAGSVIVGLASAGGLYWFLTRNQETTDDAFIAANVVQIAPRVAGTVQALRMDDNQRVHAGDIIVELDARNYEAAVAQAQAELEAARHTEEAARRELALTEATTAAQLRQAQAQVSLAEASIAQAQEKVAASRAEVDLNQAEASRYGGLAATDVATKEKLDEVTAALRIAEAQLRADRQAVKVAEAELGKAKAQLEVANTAALEVAKSRAQRKTASANVASAEAELRAAEIDLSYTRIAAPGDGFVTNRAANPGDAVEPGQTLTSLVVGRPWVVANFKETQLARIRPGQPVDIAVDAYPGEQLRGHVDSIQRGSGAAFSLLPPENATGNFVKVVQRVPVKIVIDDALGQEMVLGPGMSVEPTVHVDAAPSDRSADAL